MFCIKKQFEHLSLVISARFFFSIFASRFSRSLFCFQPEPPCNSLRLSQRQTRRTLNVTQAGLVNVSRAGTQDGLNIWLEFFAFYFFQRGNWLMDRKNAFLDWRRKKKLRRKISLAKRILFRCFDWNLHTTGGFLAILLATPSPLPWRLLCEITGLTQLRENSTKKRHQKHKNSPFLVNLKWKKKSQRLVKLVVWWNIVQIFC